jgi:hypothetical protein
MAWQGGTEGAGVRKKKGRKEMVTNRWTGLPEERATEMTEKRRND